MTEEQWEIVSKILELKHKMALAESKKDWISKVHYMEQIRMLEEIKKELA